MNPVIDIMDTGLYKRGREGYLLDTSDLQLDAIGELPYNQVKKYGNHIISHGYTTEDIKADEEDYYLRISKKELVHLNTVTKNNNRYKAYEYNVSEGNLYMMLYEGDNTRKGYPDYKIKTKKIKLD